MGVSNGRYVYQQLGLDRYLEYTDHGDWMVTDSVRSSEGYLSHLGGSVCPEHASAMWDVTRYDQVSGQDVWSHDETLTVKCVQVNMSLFTSLKLI